MTGLADFYQASNYDDTQWSIQFIISKPYQFGLLLETHGGKGRNKTKVTETTTQHLHRYFHLILTMNLEKYFTSQRLPFS